MPVGTGCVSGNDDSGESLGKFGYSMVVIIGKYCSEMDMTCSITLQLLLWNEDSILMLYENWKTLKSNNFRHNFLSKLTSSVIVYNSNVLVEQLHFEILR